jgi:hypothetical protein
VGKTAARGNGQFSRANAIGAHFVTATSFTSRLPKAKPMLKLTFAAA